MEVVAHMEGTQFAPADVTTAVVAVQLSAEHGLAAADAMIYATARLQRCELVTADADFRGLPGSHPAGACRGVNRPVPVLRGPRVTLRPPAAGDADAARRIGVHPEIERLFGEEAGDDWRELTASEADDLLVRSVPPPTA